MSLPASEPFTGTGALSASWSLPTGSCVRDTDAGRANTAGSDNFAVWNADAFSNDQESTIDVASFGAGDYIEVLCRGATGAVTTYLVYFSSGTNIIISKYVSGTQTDLQDTGVTAVVGNQVKLQVTSTSIKAYKNGAQIGSTATDSSIASGACGWGGYGNTPKVDNWVGANVGGGGGGDPAAAGFRSLLGVGPK
jgi:hypothetical protein